MTYFEGDHSYSKAELENLPKEEFNHLYYGEPGFSVGAPPGQRQPSIAEVFPDPVDVAGQLLNVTTGLHILDPGPHDIGTPKRFADTLAELTACAPFRADADHMEKCVKFKRFENDGVDEMITVANIEFVSICNHHVVPFVGKAHIAYIPDAWILGLSKLPRVVRHFARQLQVQERLTNQVAEFLQTQLDPLGLIVMMTAEHMCMTIRGVQAPGTLTTTTKTLGVFGDHDRTAKAEFLETLRSNNV